MEVRYMHRFLKTFLLGIAAGASIGLGGLAFLACKSFAEPAVIGHVAGSFMFSIGLLCVCSFGFFLFTGKIGYVFDNKPNYLLDLLFGYLGNIVGAVAVGYICYGANCVPYVVQGIVELRTNEGPLTPLLLGFICGIFVYFAVDLFKKKPGVIGTLGLIFAVAGFVVVGSEHCIANMIYFSAANAWGGEAILNILLVTIGNSLGAIAMRQLVKLAEPKPEPAA
ncbi:MAG: formate/nitrite transporter family protein [Bacilli bacterium]|nr:formate/nitrite transporter family protein [Bacilli bacterium]